jgi:hypothetical protein
VSQLATIDVDRLERDRNGLFTAKQWATISWPRGLRLALRVAPGRLVISRRTGKRLSPPEESDSQPTAI